MSAFLTSRWPPMDSFSYYFCLMIEGSGAGRVPLTYGSGSGRLQTYGSSGFGRLFYSCFRRLRYFLIHIDVGLPDEPLAAHGLLFLLFLLDDRRIRIRAVRLTIGSGSGSRRPQPYGSYAFRIRIHKTVLFPPKTTISLPT
jgi:hypothetical protein